MNWLRKNFAPGKMLKAFMGLSIRERILVGAAGGGLFLYFLFLPIQTVINHSQENDELLERRLRDLEHITILAQKYQTLNQRLERLRLH